MRVGHVWGVKSPAAAQAFAYKVHKLVQRYAGMSASASHPFRALWRGAAARTSGFDRGDKLIKDSAADTARREAIVEKLESDHVNMAASWVPADNPVKVHVVYHAVRDEATAHKILDGGFAALQRLDPGWYGRGVYFSHSLRYPCTVYGARDDDGYKTVLACLVATGNPYPVVPKEGPSRGWGDAGHPSDNVARPQSISNQPMATRHDAHVTYVKFEYDAGFDPHAPKPEGHLLPVKRREDLAEPWAHSEVVIADESQVLPVAILKVKNI